MNKHKHIYSSKQSGAVSMITVLFVTMIFTVLVLGFVRLMISEQRQATDDDLSSRAYFAAESGVEDAKAALAEYMMSGGSFSPTQQATAESCDTFGQEFLIDEPGLETEVTCQTIEPNLSDVLADSVPAWHSFLIPLRTQENYSRLQLEWHRPENDGTTFNLRGSELSLPVPDDWLVAQHPAALKMTLIRASSTGNFDEDAIIEDTRIVHMLPSSSGVNSFDTSASNFGLGGGDSLPRVACQPSGSIEVDSYSCEANFTNLSSNNFDYYVMLTPLYRSASIRLSLYNSAGDAVDISNAQAEVDVTARAGDVFRRVRARVLLTDPSLALIPDLAVGANEVCKNYVLRANQDEAGNTFSEINLGVMDPSEYCVDHSF